MKQIQNSNGKRPCLFAAGAVVRGCFLSILVGILAGGSWIFPPPAAAEEAIINCDAHNGICTQSSGDLFVSLEISPRPVKAMQDLVFTGRGHACHEDGPESGDVKTHRSRYLRGNRRDRSLQER